MHIEKYILTVFFIQNPQTEKENLQMFLLSLTLDTYGWEIIQLLRQAYFDIGFSLTSTL